MKDEASDQIRSAGRAVTVADSDDEIDLLELVRTLWRGKVWIVLSAILIGSLGWAWASYLAVPKYTARASVALENRQSQFVDIQNVMSGLSGDQATINTEVEVLRSRELLERLVDEMGLTEDPTFNPFLTSETPAPSAQEALNATVDAVVEAVSISNLRSSYVFTITAVTTDPAKSERLANGLADAYIAYQIDLKFRAMEEATVWLSSRVSDLKVQLETAETRLKTFAARTTLVSAEGLEQLNVQIKDTRDRIESLNRLREQADARIAALEAARKSADRGRMNEVAAEPELNDLYTNQDMTSAPSQSAFDARFELLLTQVRRELSRITSQSMSLGGSLAAMERTYQVQSQDLVTLQQLEREAVASRAIYEQFLTRMTEIDVQRGIQQADSRVLSYATQPREPSEPRKGRVIALATILGLMLGGGLVLLREMLHSGYRAADALELDTGLSVLGQIPLIPGKSRRATITHLVEKPASAAAEAVRNLRTSLLLSNIDHPPQVIVSTSSLPGEGKTSTAIALAHNLSGLGKKVLLIEGDIRRRVFNAYFDIEDRDGFLSVLSGAKPLEAVVQHDPFVGFDVILGAQSKTNAADVFASERFSDFMKDVRGRYDTIIIDTPPLLLVPDARIIAQSADALLLTVKWDATSRGQVQESVRLIRMAGLKLTGLVLNQIDPKGMRRYGYGERYGAYASHGNKYYHG